MPETGKADRDALTEARNKAVPLGDQQGTAWDVTLFLAFDEARLITGAILPVDGSELWAAINWKE